ncbi:MAG: hypothetical protein ACUZ8O_16270 [Candidatus Anammoxibacter sp.]
MVALASSQVRDITQVQRPFLDRIRPPTDTTPTPTPAAKAISSLIVSPVSAFSTVTNMQTATVTVLDQSGQPMSGITIVASTNGNTVTVIPPAAVTKTDGAAEFQFRFRSFIADKVITFMPDNLTATITQTQ